jgi:methylthioribose-1-phosphate isomerase
VLVGADRIVANGDVANKIGTYNVAVLADVHHIPFFVAAPLSTFDVKIAQGSAIPIEERAESEVTAPHGIAIAPPGIKVYSPAFDITPVRYISGIITEECILRPPLDQAIAKQFGK